MKTKYEEFDEARKDAEKYENQVTEQYNQRNEVRLFKKI